MSQAVNELWKAKSVVLIVFIPVDFTLYSSGYKITPKPGEILAQISKESAASATGAAEIIISSTLADVSKLYMKFNIC